MISGKYRLVPNGQLIGNGPIDRSSNRYTKRYWWGTRHTFYTDAAARKYAHDVRMVAHLNGAGALLGGAIFGGLGAVPYGLTAVYGYSLADSVDYNASLPGNGVVLDINHFLIFTCNPRKKEVIIMKWWQYTIILIIIIFGGKTINLIINTIVGKEQYQAFRKRHKFSFKIIPILLIIMGVLVMRIAIWGSLL